MLLPSVAASTQSRVRCCSLPEVHRWAYDFSVPGEKEDFIPQDVPRQA